MDTNTLTSMGTGFLRIVIMLIAGLVISGILGFATHLILKWYKYQQFKCVIFKRDALGQIEQLYDTAGIFVDNKTNNKRFFLKRNKVGLCPDNVPVISGKKKTVYLMQHGLKNFRFIQMDIGKEFNLNIGEEDVNWAINAYERQKKMFSQSMFMQMLPFIAIAFTSIIILIIFIYFFKEFSSLREFAIVMKDVAANMAQMNSGTTVIPGVE